MDDILSTRSLFLRVIGSGPSISEPFRARLQQLSEDLGHFLSVCDVESREDILTRISFQILNHLKDLEEIAKPIEGEKRMEPASPLLTEVMGEFTNEDVQRGLNEIRTTGGIALSDLIDEFLAENARRV